jgi:uncharacterized membrane protein (UPF0182 family)
VSAGSAKGVPARVPLLDPGPYASTFQVLEGRTAVKITNVDLDRYKIDGELRPVLLAARSSDAGGLPQGGWEQRHLVYTHGDGLAVAPGGRGASRRPPRLRVPDRRVRGRSPRSCTSARASRTGTQSSAPSALSRTAPTFDAETGIAMNSIWRKGALALTQGELDPLVSDYVTDDSQLLYRRDINERLHTMAPFLKFGSDPYPVVADGRITWVIDGYTTSDTYPNSQFANTAGLAPDSDLTQGRFNY